MKGLDNWLAAVRDGLQVIGLVANYILETGQIKYSVLSQVICA